MQTVKAPWYKHAPIASMPALARALGVTEEAIQAARASIATSYRPTERPKKDGGVRITYAVARPLKAIQTRVLTRILRRVSVPDYVLGSKPGKDYLANVQYHCGSKVLFGEDVSGFYPSIKTAHVTGIFQHLLHFPPEVAGCLAELCTYRGEIPQGAPTSGDLANLALWRHEPNLVADLAAKGLRYSRYVDDIYVSATRRIAEADKTWIIGQIVRMLTLEGMRVKRHKHELASSGAAMRVHRVAINAGRPTIANSERALLRAAVHRLETDWQRMEKEAAEKALVSLRGRISRLKKLHPSEYRRLGASLQSVRKQLTKF